MKIFVNNAFKAFVSKLEEMLKKHNIDAEIVFTEKSGHVTQLSEKYFNEGFKYINSVGNPVCVNPDKKLKKEARLRGWKILQWEN